MPIPDDIPAAVPAAAGDPGHAGHAGQVGEEGAWARVWELLDALPDPAEIARRRAQTARVVHALVEQAQPVLSLTHRPTPDPDPARTPPGPIEDHAADLIGVRLVFADGTVLELIGDREDVGDAVALVGPHAPGTLLLVSGGLSAFGWSLRLRHPGGLLTLAPQTVELS